MNTDNSVKKTRRTKIYDIMYIAACLIIMFLFGAYAISAIIDGASILSPILFPIAAVIIAALAMFFRKKMPRVLNIICFCGMYFWIVSYIALSVYILSFASIQEQRAPERFAKDEQVTVMVFGCHTYGYTPGKSLTKRLDSALELLNIYPNSVCVVSGGQGDNESISEAESMRAWLCEHGINNSRIYKEDRSRNTLENISFSLELIEENGLRSDAVIGVSSRYHIARIKLLAQKNGLEFSMYPTDYDNPFWTTVYLVREYMSYVNIMIGSVFR